MIENCAAGAASGVAGSSSSSSDESASQSITFCLEALSMASLRADARRSKKAALGWLAVLARCTRCLATDVWLGAATIELKRLDTYSRAHERRVRRAFCRAFASNY